jgi:ComF family protein
VGRVCETCLARIEHIAQPMCQVCGIPLQTESSSPFLETGEDQGGGAASRCRSCTDSPPHFRRARAVARYRPGISEADQVVPSLIRRHKYGRDQSLSHALAQCLGDALPVDGENYDVVIPVPLHRRRLRWRGFNQAALLAADVAHKTGCTLDVRTLVRSRHTSPQTFQDSAQRRLNVRGAFVVTRPHQMTNRSVLLVDDVMTTGATVDECARTLLAAGARRVDVLTLARAI